MHANNLHTLQIKRIACRVTVYYARLTWELWFARTRRERERNRARARERERERIEPERRILCCIDETFIYEFRYFTGIHSSCIILRLPSIVRRKEESRNDRCARPFIHSTAYFALLLFVFLQFVLRILWTASLSPLLLLFHVLADCILSAPVWSAPRMCVHASMYVCMYASAGGPGS
jgi:hypothetical protein